MDINFEKRKIQIKCIAEACIQQGLTSDSEDYDFRTFEVTLLNLRDLIDACMEDSVGFYYNALLSFLEGVCQLSDRQYSWGIVKLYYTVYYCARAQLGFNKYVVIRKQNELYDLHLLSGEKPHYNKSRNDHNLVIELYYKKFPTNNVFSNNVEDQRFTNYMMNLREITNYKLQAMKDPLRLEIFETLNESQKAGKSISAFLIDCLKDMSLYCFNSKYAYLVTTYKMLLDTANLYKTRGYRMSTIQSKYLRKLLQKSRMTAYETDLIG
ncbi:MAG: hypothetical protein IKO26_02435 [Paludibacteraceae bacterium]|nr:hypothetical protein [Paludibacteraceae bacterium]